VGMMLPPRPGRCALEQPSPREERSLFFLRTAGLALARPPADPRERGGCKRVAAIPAIPPPVAPGSR
jgi:hypothetical protein